MASRAPTFLPAMDALTDETGDIMNDEDLIEQADGSETVAEEPKRCREHPVSGTWMHVTPHDGCPPYLRGAKRNVRRMIP